MLEETVLGSRSGMGQPAGAEACGWHAMTAGPIQVPGCLSSLPSPPEHPSPKTMKHRAASALALALAAALLLGAAGPAAQAAPVNPSQPRLALLFNASVGTACAGRCSLRAVATACGTSSAAVAAAGETSADLLRGWNSLSLDWPAAPALTATVAVDCWDPACTAQPSRFVAWRGAECGGNASAAPPTLPARPLPGLASGSADRVFILGGSQPALVISYSAPQAQPTAATASPTAPNGTAERPPPTNTTAALSSPAASADRRQAEREQCGAVRRYSAVLKVALAAWTLGCAALGARL